MRVCIAGGGGYLGTHLARRLQSDGIHTVLLDVAFTVQSNTELDEQLTTRVTGSILDEKMVSEALSECESCFHIAAYGMSGMQYFNEKMIYEINVNGTLQLLDCCKRMGVQRFVFASSVSVIFTSKELHCATEDYPYPNESEYVSAYCASKAMAERAVTAADCPSIRTCSLRLRGIYGPGEPRTVDRAAELIYRGLYVATFSQRSVAMTQYSGVHNVADAMCRADKELSRAQPRCAGKTYHVVDAEPVNSFLFWMPLITALSRNPPSFRIPFFIIYFFAYLMEWIAVILRIPPVMNRLEVNLVGITNTYSIERAMKDFDYKPTRNHDLTEIVEYYQKQYEANPKITIVDIQHFFKVIGVPAILLLSFAVAFLLF
ncbi:hypothetical protein Q1695_011976 [Nippostrongylus brasiliensis]|nr:hypothetical protein Q1695_011976 [Nippostrongylus brasiliensis]